MRYFPRPASLAGPLVVVASLGFGASASHAQAPATSPRPNSPASSNPSMNGYAASAPAYAAPAAPVRRAARQAIAPRSLRVRPHNEYGRADSYLYKS
jgi:hypothetical protein